MHSDDLLALLQRAHAGEDPDSLLIEHYLTADRSDHVEGEND